MTSPPILTRSSWPAARRVLLTLEHLTEELVAGYGSTFLAVRTLDAVSCDVFSGELLVLSGGKVSGALSLLRVMRGRLSPARGERRVAEEVQVRRASIPEFAGRAIVDGWRDSSGRAPVPGDPTPPHAGAECGSGIARAPVVYLFRVRQDDQGVDRAEPSHGAVLSWRKWAAGLPQAGGSVVLAMDLDSTGTSTAENSPLGETAARPYPRVVNAQRIRRENELPGLPRGYRQPHSHVMEPAAVSDADIRVLTLRDGRIVNAVRG